jgi:Zn-dependent M28 family amino/carboxypeptidase
VSVASLAGPAGRALPARVGAALIGVALAFGGCQLAPSAAPATPSTGPVGTAPASAAPGTSPGAGTTFADQLRDAISVDDILADLGRLDGIATANGGTRVAGGSGYDASAEFVAGELRAAGYDVQLVPAQIATFRVDAPTILEILGPSVPTFQDTRDVKPMVLSPRGDVTAKVFALGFDPAAPPGSRAGLGCSAEDWVGAPAGVIALVQPGPCPRRDAIVNAQNAGALAIVIAYPEWVADRVLRPTLVNPDGLEIPAVGATNEVGLALSAAAQSDANVHLAVSTTVEIEASSNVIAETPGGDPGHVVMLGGHLDSVVDGPGINDNGSGTMTVLEIARELARLRPEGAPWKVRVAFWTGEETFLLGSFDYVGKLDPEVLATIEAYLNFDMLGSVNGAREVYDGSVGSRPLANTVIQGLFAQALDQAGVSWELADVGGASDHAAFDQLGIPVGGLFSGASEMKTEDQAARFGGTAFLPKDPCYHLLCDTAANIDPELLGEMARAAAWVTGMLAAGEVVLPEG